MRPCVRACIQAWGRMHYPTGLPLTASFFPSFCRHFSRLLYNPTCGTCLQSSARAKHFYHTAGSDWTGVYRIIECTRMWVAVEPAVCTVCRRRRSKVCSTLVHPSATPCRKAGDMKRPLIAIDLSLCIHHLSRQFCSVDDHPHRSLRSARTNRLLVWSVKLSTVCGRAFPVAGPTISNSLPDNVISAPSLSTFCQRLKHFCSRPRSLTLSLIPG